MGENMKAEEALAAAKKYTNETALGTGAVQIPGPPGKNIELQNNGTHVQWRVLGAVLWDNLIELSELKGIGDDGETPEFQMSGNTLQYKFPTQDTWTDLFTFSNGGYSPPAGGIPESDLAQSVKDALIKARSAVQDETDPIYTADKDKIALKTETAAVQADVDAISAIIPTAASPANKLVDAETMNTAVTRIAARYVTETATGDTQFESFDALNSGPWFYQGRSYIPDDHDFAIFINTDKSVWWAGFDGVQWGAQFKINDTPFTSSQIAVLNSEITAGLVEKLKGLPDNDALAVLLAGKVEQSDIDTSINEHNIDETSHGLDGIKKAIKDLEVSQGMPVAPTGEVHGAVGDRWYVLDDIAKRAVIMVSETLSVAENAGVITIEQEDFDRLDEFTVDYNGVRVVFTKGSPVNILYGVGEGRIFYKFVFNQQNRTITITSEGKLALEGSGGVTSTLLSAAVPMAAANMVVLVFDNFVRITDASGFSVSGISDALEFVDQPNIKTIRLRLASEFFIQNEAYTLNYDPAIGNVLQMNDAPIAAINGFGIDNYADYSPAEFVDAQIPLAEPSTLVLVMSRAISISDVSGFSLTGTTARITGLVSDGATVEFSLDEPVDGDERNIELSFNGFGVIDNVGQPVEAFSGAVENNSAHTAITVQAAEVPSNNSKQLIVVMEGAVSMSSAAGFSLSSIDQNDLPDLSQFSVSDGTITFTLSKSLLEGKTFTVSYDGTGTLRAVNNNDKIKAFSEEVTNNSTDTGGIPQGSEARDLGVLVLGHAPTDANEFLQILEMIQQTVENGMAANFADSSGEALGDYFSPALSSSYPFVVQAGHDSGGAINLTSNADLINGKHISFHISSYNGHMGKNGVDYDHVWVSMVNIPGYSSDAGAEGHYMNPANTNVGGFNLSKGRAYLDNMKDGLRALGVPFNEDWIAAVPRRVSKGWPSSNPGYDLIEDKLIIPTEYEMFGVCTYSNSVAEDAANQGRLEYYKNNARRTKYRKDNNSGYYWGASPYSGNSYNFCYVSTAGSASNSVASFTFGFAPAFCIRRK